MDYPNLFYKVDYKFYNVSVSSDINQQILNIIKDYMNETEKRIDLEVIKKEYREKIHYELVKNLIKSQRKISIFVTDFEDPKIHSAIESLFEGIQTPYFESQSITLLHKPLGIDYNEYITHIVNSSEHICFANKLGTSNCDDNDNLSAVPSLPRLIFESIPTRNNNRNSIVNIAFGNSKGEIIPFLDKTSENKVKNIETPLRNIVESLLSNYVEEMLRNYLKYQSDFQTLLAEFSFRSPLNFLMVKHDYSIFIHEYLRCETKLKFGLNFIQQSFLSHYNAGNLTDSRAKKYDVGNRFLVEKDNCKAKVSFIIQNKFR